jgi:hypothetical protein
MIAYIDSTHSACRCSMCLVFMFFVTFYHTMYLEEINNLHIFFSDMHWFICLKVTCVNLW